MPELAEVDETSGLVYLLVLFVLTGVASPILISLLQYQGACESSTLLFVLPNYIGMSLCTFFRPLAPTLSNYDQIAEVDETSGLGRRRKQQLPGISEGPQYSRDKLQDDGSSSSSPPRLGYQLALQAEAYTDGGFQAALEGGDNAMVHSSVGSGFRDGGGGGSSSIGGSSSGSGGSDNSGGSGSSGGGRAVKGGGGGGGEGGGMPWALISLLCVLDVISGKARRRPTLPASSIKTLTLLPSRPLALLILFPTSLRPSSLPPLLP